MLTGPKVVGAILARLRVPGVIGATLAPPGGSAVAWKARPRPITADEIAKAGVAAGSVSAGWQLFQVGQTRVPMPEDMLVAGGRTWIVKLAIERSQGTIYDVVAVEAV